MNFEEIDKTPTWSMRLFKLYEKKIYPRIEKIRGTYRLKKILKSLVRTKMRKVEPSETKSIFSEDWDNLLVLDACRHDLFEEVEGDTPFRYSLGSSSADFVRENFSEGNFEDLVVITANPHYYEEIFTELTGRKPEDVFACVFHTYKKKWDEEKRTVLPQSVLEDYKTAKKLYPEKRFLLHFMQPHNPMIGGNLEVETTGFHKYMSGEKTQTEWEYAEQGVLSDEEVWRAYRKTLEYILEEIKSEKTSFEGRTLVTSDHGNFVGEEGLYGHSMRQRSEIPVRKVPWVELSDLK